MLLGREVKKFLDQTFGFSTARNNKISLSTMNDDLYIKYQNAKHADRKKLYIEELCKGLNIKDKNSEQYNKVSNWVTSNIDLTFDYSKSLEYASLHGSIDYVISFVLGYDQGKPINQIEIKFK